MVSPRWCGRTDCAGQSSDLNLTKQLRDEPAYPCGKPYRPTSVADLTDALVAEWEYIAAAQITKSCVNSQTSQSQKRVTVPDIFLCSDCSQITSDTQFSVTV